MTEQEKRSSAQAILAIPLFDELMNKLEEDEITAAMAADYTAHEKRQGHMAALRAIRNLRSKIGALASQPTVRKQAPA